MLRVVEAAAAAIADPTRRKVLELVRDAELAAGEIAAEFEISRPAGLVSERREGRLRLYRADPSPLAELSHWLEEYWSGRLAALKALAEEER